MNRRGFLKTIFVGITSFWVHALFPKFVTEPSAQPMSVLPSGSERVYTMEEARKKYAKWHSKAKNNNDHLNAQEQFLADKHLIDGDMSIFKRVHLKAKTEYYEAMKDYYSGKIRLKEYLARRGGRIGQGLSYYDKRLVDLGLGTTVLPDDKREEYAVKSFKTERRIFPAGLIPINFTDIKTNDALWKRLSLSARETTLIALEAFDYYNKHFVPSLKDNWRFREGSKPCDEDVYKKQGYLDVSISPQEIKQFRKWRDGL